MDYRKERERALHNTPVDSLVHRLITEEYHSKETRKLLKTAITRLEASSQRAAKAEQERREIETTQALHGLRVSQGVIDAQQEAAKAHHEAETYKLQLEHAQRELCVSFSLSTFCVVLTMA